MPVTVITIIDDCGGLMFHNRRQSQDRILRQRICQLAAGKRLWMNVYSARLFAGDDCSAVQIITAEDFLLRAAAGDFCFVETLPLQPCQHRIEKLILFHWNRRYPADLRFDLDLSDWLQEGQEEFSGSSHPLITMEIYRHPEYGKKE